MLRFIVSSLVSALVLSACGTGQSGTSNAERLTASDWQAVAMNDAPVSTPTPVTLSFQEGRVSGRSGCNYYSGAAEYGDTHIKLGPMISTKMACAHPGVMQFEMSYLQTLQSAERYSIALDGQLVITGTLGSVRFAPNPRQNRP